MNDWEGSGGISGTLMCDMAFSIAFIFIIFFIFISPFVNSQSKKDKGANIKMPGNIMVWIRWPDNVDVDVDLWVRAPHDKPVGYSNRAGNTFNLLRDDLGMIRDSTPFNYEVAFGRDMPSGTYTVNVHLYRNGSELTAVPVDADVFISYGSQTVSIVKKSVVLERVGQEITVANFTLADGKPVGKPNDVQVPLRNETGGGP